MANIKGKGTLYQNQFGWSISQKKKDKNGVDQVFYIPCRILKQAEPRAAHRKFIEFEGFTNHYKTRDGKTMTDFVITHILDKQEVKVDEVDDHQINPDDLPY